MDVCDKPKGSMQNANCPPEAPPEVDSPQAKDPLLAEKMQNGRKSEETLLPKQDL